MSINSWKKEFYRGRVQVAARDVVSATEHSIVKWTGLSEANLKKHGLVKDKDSACGDRITNPKTGGQFTVGEGECALCLYDSHQIIISCYACPLPKVNAMCRDCNSPYQYWTLTGNNKPMLAALKKALAYVKKEQPND